MFDRFTGRARKVLSLSRQEAQRFRHDYIGPEHILLALLKEGTGVAVSVLKDLNVDFEGVRKFVEERVGEGAATVMMGQIPFTPRGKRVLEFALDEATDLGHTHIGTEHLLLGLFEEDEGIAAQVLRSHGLDQGMVRTEVLRRVGGESPDVDEADDDAPITPHAKRACLRAHALASGRDRLVSPLDLLFGLLDLRDPEIEALLAQWGVDPEGFRKNVEGRLDEAQPPEAGAP